ncbi:MAG: hypothetical protein JSV25_08005 [Spirochaetota bacterium]|nr:MAG: hypothetical protein JSV25_08005 [Spirochaetota bacterium]
MGESEKIQHLVDGRWHGEDFLTIEPGRRLGFNAHFGTLQVDSSTQP